MNNSTLVHNLIIARAHSHHRSCTLSSTLVHILLPCVATHPVDDVRGGLIVDRRLAAAARVRRGELEGSVADTGERPQTELKREGVGWRERLIRS